MNTSQLTFTRFIAAMMIVYYHFGHYVFQTDNHFINILKFHLSQGVTYFYVLSGFVMMLAYGSKAHVSFGSYMKNRIARIYPLHVFALLLSLLVYVIVHINYLSDLKFHVPSFIASLFLYQSWIPEYSLSYNVPSWSVSVELFFYIIFPLFFNQIIKKLKASWVIMGIFIFWMIMQVGMNMYYHSEDYGGYASMDRYFLYFNPFFHVSSFLIGISAGILFKNAPGKKSKNYDILIMILLAVTAIGIYLVRNMFLHNGLFSVFYAAIIYFIAGNTGFITKIFRNKTLVYLGEISFAVYILQNPVFIFIGKVFKTLKIDHPYAIFFTGTAALLITSMLVYKYLEMPMRDKIRNYKFLAK